jgi:hypothetical protein
MTRCATLLRNGIASASCNKERTLIHASVSPAGAATQGKTYSGDGTKKGDAKMKYYIQVSPTQHAGIEPIWKVENNAANPIHVLDFNPAPYPVGIGEEVVVSLQKHFPGSKFYELSLAPGQYYPRMARPDNTRENESPGKNPDKSDNFLHARATSTGQLHALIGQLEQICRVIHPKGANLKAYGHETRNLLILACTELEAHWKNILKANCKRGKNTTHYSRLSGPMKLGEYRVELSYYPWIRPIQPFKNWVQSKTASQDLRWYAAYNHVKHDRETNFSEATLLNAIHAVTGCFVMLCAQYGWDFALRGDQASRAFFRLTKAPRWEPSDIYVPPYGREYEIVRYPFTKMDSSAQKEDVEPDECP